MTFQVEGIDEDNCRVIVCMTLSGDRVTLSQLAVKLVEKEEYKKYSKYLSKYCKYQLYPAKYSQYL